MEILTETSPTKPSATIETALATEEVKYNFDGDFQDKILTHVLRDESFMQLGSGVIFPNFFEDVGAQWLANYSLEYFKRFNQVPSLAIIGNDLKILKTSGKIKAEVLEAVTDKIRLVYSPKADLSNRDYTLEQTGAFAQKKALENAILNAAMLLDKGGDNYDKAYKLIEDARGIGVIDDGVSYEYYESVEQRIDERLERDRLGAKTGITTGVKELDNVLYHGGWGRKELSVLMGPPKAGKSIGLGEFAINASQAGYNVLYCSLENSASIVGDRMDANLSGTIMRDVTSAPGAIRGAISLATGKAGKLYIHEYPTGTMKPQDIRRLIKRYQSRGVVIDIVVVDYADIMAADYRSGEERLDSKQIYQGLRAIAQQENVAMLTATQTNREGAKATVAKATDVSEDINRLRIADVFMVIAASDQEKAEDTFRLYMSAMRNSESGIMFTCKSDRKRMKFIKKIEKGTM